MQCAICNMKLKLLSIVRCHLPRKIHIVFLMVCEESSKDKVCNNESEATDYRPYQFWNIQVMSSDAFVGTCTSECLLIACIKVFAEWRTGHPTEYQNQNLSLALCLLFTPAQHTLL